MSHANAPRFMQRMSTLGGKQFSKLAPIAEEPAHKEGEKTPINEPLKLSIPLLDDESEPLIPTIPEIRISLHKLKSVPSGDNVNSSKTNSNDKTPKKKESMDEVLRSMEQEEAAQGGAPAEIPGISTDETEEPQHKPLHLFLFVILQIGYVFQFCIVALYCASIPGNKFFNGMIFGGGELCFIFLSGIILKTLGDMKAFYLV